MRLKAVMLAMFLIGQGATVLGDTLDTVKKKGFVQCGVSQGLPGFSAPDDKGLWSGLDVDYCRALAAAIFGDASKVRFRPLSAKERFTALQSGEIDILSRNTTWTISRDTTLGVDFVGVIYYDGHGFMIAKKNAVKSVKELDGATICVNLGTTTELNLADYFRTHGMKYKLVTFEKMDEVNKAYDAGRCDAITTDQSGLYSDRTRLRNPEDNLILPEIISKEPLGPAVRQGDQRWGDIARWTLYALLEAEELGISSKNIDTHKGSKNPSVSRLIGAEGDFGKGLGLDTKWAYNLIKQVGNYEEIFEKNLGSNSRLKIARGQNNLWTKGGLHYPMPFR